MNTVRTRRRAALAFCACVLSAQAYAVVNAYHDPLKRFGYQPFAESTVFRVHIDAVARNGERRDIEHGFEGYRWQDLVHERVGNPFHTQSASSGIGASLYFLQRALDYVAEHTPEDRRTRYLEASVVYSKNHGAERTASLRSKPRDVP